MNVVKRFFLLLKMGRAYARNDLKKATSYAREYLNYKSDDERVLWLLVDCSFRMQKYDEAESYAAHLLSINKDHPEALQKMSIICYKRGDYSDAYSFVCRVLEVSSANNGVDSMLDDLGSNRFFSHVAKNVRHALDHERQESNEWLEWALQFKQWYEGSLQDSQ